MGNWSTVRQKWKRLLLLFLSLTTRATRRTCACRIRGSRWPRARRWSGVLSKGTNPNSTNRYAPILLLYTQPPRTLHFLSVSVSAISNNTHIQGIVAIFLLLHPLTFVFQSYLFFCRVPFRFSHRVEVFCIHMLYVLRDRPTLTKPAK
ncbi:hypothetical protein RSAG8_08190, partial [Rhizoctonia solani AG-8 WAC10335]